MIIDNFDIIRPHLTFEPARKFDLKSGNFEEINDTYDRYVAMVLKRAKDPDGKSNGSNTGNRLVKTYEISSLDYFDRKRPDIIDLCERNGARAYILPQVRSTYDCLKEMIKIGVDNLENPTVKFQHILRSAICSMHKSRAKRWVLDLDNDNMTEWRRSAGFFNETTWTLDDVLKLVREELSACGKNPDDAWVVPTRSGHHIVTPTFNLEDAHKKCDRMFEGESLLPQGIRYTGPGEYEVIMKKCSGWLHKDGMTLMYVNL